MTLADLISQVTSSVNSFVPDLSVFIAAGVVITLVAAAIKRLVRAGR